MAQRSFELDAYVAAHPGVERDTARKRLNRMERPAPIATPAARRYLTLPDGIIIAAGDAHYWPGEPSAAHRALVPLIHALRPSAIILMGDIIDGSRISRWPLGAWSDALARPTVTEEMAVAQA